MSFLWLVVPILVGLTIARDPLVDFCRLHSHRTAVVDRKLYVDAGFVNWAPIKADPANQTNTWLRVADFGTSRLGFPNQTTLEKNAAAPSVSGGILWPDTVNKIIYAYGGEHENSDTADKRLWFYDILYDTWNVSITNSITSISPAAWGAGTIASNKALGYYYGGWPTSSTNSDDSSTKALSTMVVYNMLENKFSTQLGPDQIGRAEGVMLYVPAGDAGVLIYFGGIQVINGTHQPLPMSDIFIYDIANARWYRQTTSGAELPGSRRRACAGVVWAEDRSSYNIYLYGGASVGEGEGYGDVWVLSLPSFTWIKSVPTAEDIVVTTPRHSLTCDVYENSQMVIVGGHLTKSTDCDVPWIYGQHSLYLGRSNIDGLKRAAFNASLSTYDVPQEVTDVIGGDSAGHATVTAPKDGWESEDSGVVFGQKYTPVPRSPTRPIITPAAKSSNPKEISILGPAVGGTIGGVFLIAAIGYYLILIRRRRRREHSTTPPESHYHISQSSPHVELPGALARSYSSTSLHSREPNSLPYTPHYTYPPHGAAGSWANAGRHDTHTLHAWGLSELGDEKQQRLLVPAHELSGVRSPRQSVRHSKFKEEDFAGN
ncbi:uncharacterized protein EKO05_0006355 [Ascochyta rabiei]|uniref:Uncharacterized protein n=1 Tax=Didymella rabiei TaxID=5454 RepID=A0A163A086_DIDRA|nr:uncharacterized protein EKO05_0006355 [Ascochyta rabiei]KZM20907.1 hypothetical protein ST47_g7936 [Ascochyta rabiei]UPX15924.1 hypothetical protein EKO05_0006355 [Ascochyta rabiei]